MKNNNFVNLGTKNVLKKYIRKRQSHTFSTTKDIVNALFHDPETESLGLGGGMKGAVFLVVRIRRRGRIVVVVDLLGNLLHQGFTLRFLVLVMFRHVSDHTQNLAFSIADPSVKGTLNPQFQSKFLEGIRNSPYSGERVQKLKWS